MERTPLSVPEIAIISGTRAALGAGMALLLSDRLTQDQRRATGWTLFGVGVVSTVPIVLELLRSKHELSGDEGAPELVVHGRRNRHFAG